MANGQWLMVTNSLQRYVILNFDEIFHSTAEVLLLLVSENKRPPYWNSTSGFVFDLFIVNGASFCIFLPNFVGTPKDYTCNGVMMSYRLFNMAAVGRGDQ